ncbi:MAG TPA: GNAT family N-acetyltransferase [Terriglobales bacterium]|nr:GNAT family N-acetyltransferase [Terriglobales bacterium]
MEAAEEFGALRYAQAMQERKPEMGACWEQFLGGDIVFVARRSPVGRAHGLGFAEKVTPDDIEHVEDFYFQREAHAQVDVCPYADSSLFEALNRRGFQVAEFNQTLARWILPEEKFAAQPGRGIEIRRVKPDEARIWSELCAKVFFEDQAPRFSDFFLPWAAPEHPLALAAFVDGTMVGVAGGLIVPEHNMAGFFGAATLSEFRGRGIQTAFMQERLRLAQQAGCTLAVTLTMPGTTSQRNVERTGFRTAYTKVVCIKRHPNSKGSVQVHYSK